MKRVVLLFLCFLFLTGCSSKTAALDVGFQLRSDILNSEGCSFVADVTADYGDDLYEFKMQCDFDKNGALAFEVIKPDTISGITGKIDANTGAFTFDDQVLAFQKLADGQITPVTAPWVLMKAIRGGYIAAGTKSETGYYLQLDDSFQQDLLTVDLWLDGNGIVSHGEFLWDGHRIVSVKVSNFKFL